MLVTVLTRHILSEPASVQKMRQIKQTYIYKEEVIIFNFEFLRNNTRELFFFNVSFSEGISSTKITTSAAETTTTWLTTETVPVFATEEPRVRGKPVPDRNNKATLPFYYQTAIYLPRWKYYLDLVLIGVRLVCVCVFVGSLCDG